MSIVAVDEMTREKFISELACRWGQSRDVVWDRIKEDLDALIENERKQVLKNAEEGWIELSNEYVNLKKDFDDLMGIAEAMFLTRDASPLNFEKAKDIFFKWKSNRSGRGW